MYRKGGYIVARIFGFLTVLIMAAIVAIQTPYIQTRLSKVALNQLAAIMDGRVTYDELKVMTSGVLVIRNIMLMDGSPYTEDVNQRGWDPVDTVFFAKTITATFAIDGLFKGEGLHLGRVTVEDGYFHLVSEPVAPGNNLSRIFNMPPQTGPQEPGPDIFDIKKVRVKNFRFRLNSFLPPLSAPVYDAPHINFEDLDITADVTGHNLRMTGGKMYGYCDHVYAREKSGYVVEDLSASCEVGLGKTLVEDIHFVDPWSDVRLRSFSMTYPWSIAFRDFLHEVMLEGDFQRTRIALQTLSYFAGGVFDGRTTALNIRRGHARGYVSDFRVENLVFTEQDSDIAASLSGTCTGLPDITRTTLDIQLKDLTATPDGATRLVAGLVPGTRLKLPLDRDLPVTLQLRAKGPMEHLTFDGEMLTPEGTARFDGNIRNLVNPHRPVEIAAALTTQELHLGHILGNSALGPVSLSTRARATLRNGLPDADIDTLRIERIRAFGREFQHLNVAGGLRGGTVDAHLISEDPSVRFNLTALADLTERESGNRYRINGTLDDVDLKALGIAAGPVSRISTGINADLLRQGEFFDGDALLPGLRLTNDSGSHRVGDLRLAARTNDGRQSFTLDAPFLDASYTGTRQVDKFVRDLLDVTLRRDLSALAPDIQPEEENGDYSAELHFHDTHDLLSLLLPGAYIEDHTALSLTLAPDGTLDGGLNSRRLAIGKNFLKDIDLSFDNRQGALLASLVSSELRAGTFALNNPSITAGADDNRISLAVNYDSFSGAGGNAEICLDGQLYRDEEGVLVVQARPHDSYLTTSDQRWTLSGSDIILRGKDLLLDQFLISNGPQRLLVKGGLSNERSDTLSLQMHRFDLALIDEFLPNPLGIEGKMNGDAFIASTAEDLLGGMLLNFSIDTLRFSGVDAGTIQISSEWNEDGDELGIFLRDRLFGRDILSARGSYLTAGKTLNLQAALDSLPLHIASPFLKTILSEMGGGVSGELTLAGPTQDLSPSGNLRLQDALLRIAATGVPYTVNGPLRVDSGGCFFDSLQIRDDTGGSGDLQGSLRFDHFNDFNLDGHLSFNNLKLVDAVERADSPFYGLLRASGTAAVSGPFNALVIDANANTSGDGNIHIPLSGRLASTNSNLLTFTQPVKELDAYEAMLAGMETKTAATSDLRIRGRLGIHPAVKAFVEIDKKAGNVASFNGAGNVTLNLRPSKAVFELNGDYNINEGNYQFVVPGLLSKGFNVQSGSSVKFVGDIMNTALDLTATYNVRTSLDALLGTESSTRRQVVCGLNISDRLRSPKIDLSIDIPDLDPATRSQMESALNTQDKIQKQFVALLLLGTFLPNEGSGVFNQSNLLFSNMTEMMSGQINNILQRMEIPVDVGFGYQEMGSGRNLFDIAVSTQLFDNRVILGGSFGNRRYSTGKAGGDFTGNMDLSVKLDPEGKFRFNIFSHSADEFSSYLDYSQRNGLGVSFQKEYPTVGSFFQSIFLPKVKREQKELEYIEKEIEQEVIVIEHEEPGETVPDSDPAGGE